MQTTERQRLMPPKRMRLGALGMTLGLLGLTFAPGVAGAQPAVPPVLPWFPGPPLPVNGTMGSYSFPANIIAVSPPAGFDARGVRAGVTNDSAMATDGLPGSALGLTANKPNALTSSSTRYRVDAGLSPNPTLPVVTPGTNVGAGMEAQVLEDPGGAAPKSPTAAESSQPTVAAAVPGEPAPILESPNGQPPAATTTTTAPPPPPGPLPVEVPAATG
jgi:hypothetical protein